MSRKRLDRRDPALRIASSQRRVGVVVGAFLAALCLWATGAHAGADSWEVGLVGSDSPSLSRPAGLDQPLCAGQVDSMVARAVWLVGGMSSVVADTAHLVVIKPNIVMAVGPETGIVTDPRVVGAVARLVHAAAPGARILIAEGSGGWRSRTPANELHGLRRWWEGMWNVAIADGFAASGYRKLTAQLRAEGMDVACFDLNYDETLQVAVPGGGQADSAYVLPVTVLRADAWINCPVIKTHGPQLTVCMKNCIGLLPGRVYGWPKSKGTQAHRGIPHSVERIEELMVDLWQVSRADLEVVDGIIGREGGALETGSPKRTNWVMAAGNPVAADLVAAELMGFNPDDMEFALLAARRGLGPRFIEQVHVRGDDPAHLARRFVKAGDAYGRRSVWHDMAVYGMGPRYWIILGPLPPGHALTPEQMRRSRPSPGRAGWSRLRFFHHDVIDLGRFSSAGRDSVLYAYTRFHMPQADSVRYWAGSSGSMQAWVDGRRVYTYEGRRRHHLGQDRISGWLDSGDYALLIRVQPGWRRAEFSFDICEPVDDPRYAGNRYPGLRYFVTDGQRAQAVPAGDGRAGVPPRVVAPLPP